MTGFPSPNCNNREGTPIDMLVMHYTGMCSGAEARGRLCDNEAKVSAHYLIDEDGTAEALVDEKMRAWHAGVAHWRGSTNINSRSVGIELVNPGHEWGYRDFTEAQYDVLIPLCRAIVARHHIPPRNVVGHSDVAPTRKQDPGERFDWARLAAAGIGLWPDGESADVSAEADVVAALAAYGYDVADEAAAITAFQRRFTPHRLDGVADAATRRTITAVLALI